VLRVCVSAEHMGGVTWFSYDGAVATANSKLYADGTEGWIAHEATVGNAALATFVRAVIAGK
jgi:hypothetical protein